MNTSTPIFGREEDQQILPDSIYMTFNAPSLNEYHRGIFVTNSFKLGQDLPSGTLFHAVHSKGVDSFEKAFWHFEVRKVLNIKSAKSLALVYRIGQLIGTTNEVAAQVQQIGEILKSVKFEASPERMEKLGNRVLEGYSCIIWVEDALSALVSGMTPRTFLPSLNFNSQTETITADGIIAEANVARRLAGPADGRLMVGKHVPGEFEVFN
jgi:hypothetical protein